MLQKTMNQQLQIDLPDKKYFTIGEVSDICDLKSHVLRYWEQVFPQLQPNKRSGRRYYQKRDLELVLEIKSLLQDQGFTIQGAKTRLSKGVKALESEMEEDTPGLQVLLKMRQELQQFNTYFNQRYK